MKYEHKISGKLHPSDIRRVSSRKYRAGRVFPKSTYWAVTGFVPNQISNKNTKTKIPNRFRIVVLCVAIAWGNGTKIKFDETRAITAPNLLGTECKIAYPNKK